jgi:hypothetical protein
MRQLGGKLPWLQLQHFQVSANDASWLQVLTFCCLDRGFALLPGF